MTSARALVASFLAVLRSRFDWRACKTVAARASAPESSASAYATLFLSKSTVLFLKTSTNSRSDSFAVRSAISCDRATAERKKRPDAVPTTPDFGRVVVFDMAAILRSCVNHVNQSHRCGPRSFPLAKTLGRSAGCCQLGRNRCEKRTRRERRRWTTDCRSTDRFEVRIFAPLCETTAHDLPAVMSRQKMPTRTEKRRDRPERRQESLRMSG